MAVQPGGAKQWVSVQRPLMPAMKEPSGLRKGKNWQESSFLQTLDGDLILSFQKESEREGEAATELKEVQRIEVRGYGVRKLDEEAFLSCVRLRICNLSECFIADIAPFYGCVNLLKLDVSDNQVTQLPAASFWKSLLSLRVLYLNGNNLSDKENLIKLNSCPKLHILTLYSTPLSLIPNYRHHVVNNIFSLKALDQYVISDQEIIENLQATDTFMALTPPFKLPLHIIVQPGSSVHEEECVVYRLLLAVERVLARHSPVAIIQRWVRGYLTRKTIMLHQNQRIREITEQHMQRRRRHTTALVEQSHGPQLLLTSASSDFILSKRQQQQQQQQQQQGYQQFSLLPPPPPSSPRTPARHPGTSITHFLETHVLGLDPNTRRLKYNMHINLRRLQQSIEQSEREFKALSLSKGGLNKTHAARGAGMQQPEAIGPAGRKAGSPARKKEAVKGAGTQSEAIGPAGKKAGSPARKAGSPARKKDVVIPAVGSQGQNVVMDGVPASKAEEDLCAGLPPPQPLYATLQTLPTQGDKEEGAEVKMAVSGLTVAVLPHESIPPLTSTKKANSDNIRQAKKEISKRMVKIKAPLVKQSTGAPLANRDVMTKDDFVFTRVYGTMNLSVLRQVEGVHHARKLSQEQEERASRVRRERVTRRSKIAAYQEQLRERMLAWRGREDGRLERAREAMDQQREAAMMRQYSKQEEAHLIWQRQQQERQFSQSFKQNNTMISNTLATEDRRVAQEETSASARERVRQVRRDSLEKQEEARRYLELRRNRLLREGRETKEELDTKMLEFASQQLIEKKKRVAKAIARSEAARAAVAMVREEMRTHPPQGPREGMPSAKQGPVVQLEGVSSPSAAATRGFGVSSEFKSPSHVTKMMNECHDTWQRGAKAIEQNQVFPPAEGVSGGGANNDLVSPFMHGMMVPHLPTKSMPCPPDTPFTELHSSTNSLHHKPQITSN